MLWNEDSSRIVHEFWHLLAVAIPGGLDGDDDQEEPLRCFDLWFLLPQVSLQVSFRLCYGVLTKKQTNHEFSEEASYKWLNVGRYEIVSNNRACNAASCWFNIGL